MIDEAQNKSFVNQEFLDASLSTLKRYIEEKNYRGYDPYDALTSPFFKLPLFNKNKLLRFSTQQLVKRLPFNIRPLLFIPKGYNPVTLGLSIQAYSYLFKSEPQNKPLHIQRINYLVEELKKQIPSGYSGACWGYDFDWEARHARIPAYQPTVVATGIITNALFVSYKITGNLEAKILVESAAKFVYKDLNRSYTGSTLCFSYSPFDQNKVFNASMKGVRLLAQAYSLNKNPDYKEIAKQATSFVVSHQRENGSWGYSLSNGGGWSDNYHSGYVLDCLDEYQELTGDYQWNKQLQKGYEFYRKHFITDRGIPKFYHNQIYPIDCTSASQTILTSLRFNDIDIAVKVARWMGENMQKPNGSFRFRKFRNYTITTSFMRWSDAWMFAALSELQQY